MNILELKNELESPEYANQTDAQILALLNEKTRAQRIVVQSADVTNFLSRNGMAGKLFVAAESHPNLQIKVASKTALLLLQSRMEQFDFALAEFQQMFAAMVAGQVFTQEEVTALEALSFVMESRAEQLWGQNSGVAQEHLNAVRLLPKLAIVQTKCDAYRAAFDAAEQAKFQLQAGVDVNIEAL